MKLIIDDSIKKSSIVKEITDTLNSASGLIKADMVVGISDCGVTYRGNRKVEIWFLYTGEDEYEMANRYEEFSRLLEDNIKLYQVESKCLRGVMYASVVWDRTDIVSEDGHESALLSSMLQDQDSWIIHKFCAKAGFSKEDFLDIGNQEIYRAIENIVMAEHIVTAESVIKELTELGTLEKAGGAEHIRMLEKHGKIGFGLDIPKWWIKEILKKSNNRKIIRHAEKNFEDLSVGDVLYSFRKEVSDLDNKVENMLFRLRELERDQYGAHCVLQRCREVVDKAKNITKETEEISTEIKITYGEHGWAKTLLHTLLFAILYSIFAGAVIEIINHL